MSKVEFRVVGWRDRYAVEMYRDGLRYIAFVEGLTKELAESEAQRLTDVWQKISLAQNGLGSADG